MKEWNLKEKKEKSLAIWKNEIWKKKTNFERLLFDQSTYPVPHFTTITKTFKYLNLIVNQNQLKMCSGSCLMWTFWVTEKVITLNNNYNKKTVTHFKYALHCLWISLSWFDHIEQLWHFHVITLSTCHCILVGNFENKVIL